MNFIPFNLDEMTFDEQFQTERLKLRPPLPGDGGAVYEAKQESILELQPWMIWANHEQTEEDTERLIQESHAAFRERSDLRFHGYLLETGELVWCGGLHRIDWGVGKFEIGYWLRSKFTGMGFATEAARGLERLAIEQLGANRIEIRIDEGNIPSIRVAERLGYTLEGTLRQDAWNADLSGLRNTRLYAKVRGVEF